MEFKKGMKKALSVLLSLSMVVTGVTVGGKEAKAEGEDEVTYEIAFPDNKTSYEGTVQDGTVTIEGTVEADDKSAVYGKIKLSSSTTGFAGTVDYVRNGAFSATVDISQVAPLTAVPVTVEFTVGGATKANADITIFVTSDSGIVASLCASSGDWGENYNGYGTNDWNTYDTSKAVALIDEKDGDENVTLELSGLWNSDKSLYVSYVSFLNLANADAVYDAGTDPQDLMTLKSVKINDTDVDMRDKVTEKDSGSGVWSETTTDYTIKMASQFEGEDNKVSQLRIVVLNPYNGAGYVKPAFGKEEKPFDKDDISSVTGTDDTLSVTFSFAASASAVNINSAAPATTPVDVTDQADPTPGPDDPVSSSDPAESTGPNSGETAEAATVTAVAMAPQAMTATAGSVTTMAAVLTVTGSSLDLLKVNNTVAANDATVSAVATSSGITVTLANPATVQVITEATEEAAEVAVATFAAVVTVPASVATGDYPLVASVGAVKANVATVSVIAASEGGGDVEVPVHTTSLKIKTANGTNKTALMGVGETAKLKVVKTPADSVDEVTAVSAKTKVVKASINSKGKLVLKAKKAGTAKVTVTSGEVSKKITVTVKKAPKKLTLKDGKKAAKKTVQLAANTKKKAVKKTYTITLPKNTASYDYTIKKTGKVVKSAVLKTTKKNVQKLVVTVKKKSKGSGKVVITSNANKKAKATVKVKATK